MLNTLKSIFQISITTFGHYSDLERNLGSVIRLKQETLLAYRL